MSHSEISLDRDRLRRIVRFMLAHVADETISSRDADNVFSLVGAKADERDAVLRALPQMGVRVRAEAPVSRPETSATIKSHVSTSPDPVLPVSRNADREDAEAARRVLRSDRWRRNPSKRTLSAQEEVGLAFLIRGSDIPLDRELPRGYRGDLDPADERAQAFDAFVVHNMRLVWSIARTQHAGQLELEDVVQHGMLGLCRAVEKFDATQGNKFSTYATWWIRQSIGRGIADDGRLIRIPVHVFEAMNKVRTARNRMLEISGTCRLSRLADETGLPEEKVIECLRLATGIVSLDKPLADDGDSLGDFVLAIPDNEADPAQLLDRAVLPELIRDALNVLTEREAMIIRLRTGLDDDMPQTLDQIGRRLGLSRERIRQIEGPAMVKLRRAVIKRGIRPIRRVRKAPAADSPHGAAQPAEPPCDSSPDGGEKYGDGASPAPR